MLARKVDQTFVAEDVNFYPVIMFFMYGVLAKLNS